MLFEKIVSEGLSHFSYIIGAGGDAAVIDPRRDCEVYLEIAREHDLAIRHIFETHRNEDYVTGSVELRGICGADIRHGRQMDFSFGTPVQEGDRFRLGSLEITVIETPGHTEESISLVVRDLAVSPDPFMVFCGDTLFAGDIARTDFYGSARKEEMAGKIFDSISGKILPLGDGVIVCPAHGPGSICGGEIADHPFTTVGYEKRSNQWLRKGRDAFIEGRLTESPYLPAYFRRMERYNHDGPPPLRRDFFPEAMGPDTVEKYRQDGCQLVDIRSPTSFGAGHIPGSISLWRNGISALAGFILEYDTPILLVDDFNIATDDVAREFMRLGYDNLRGILFGGFGTWTAAGKVTETLRTCTPLQLKERLLHEQVFLLDVRHIRNWHSSGHIPGARHIYAGEILQHLGEIPRDKPVVVYCDAGFKGSLAASLISRSGHPDVTNLLGGMNGWERAGFESVVGD